MTESAIQKDETARRRSLPIASSHVVLTALGLLLAPSIGYADDTIPPPGTDGHAFCEHAVSPKYLAEMIQPQLSAQGARVLDVYDVRKDMNFGTVVNCHAPDAIMQSIVMDKLPMCAATVMLSIGEMDIKFRPSERNGQPYITYTLVDHIDPKLLESMMADAWPEADAKRMAADKAREDFQVKAREERSVALTRARSEHPEPRGVFTQSSIDRDNFSTRAWVHCNNLGRKHGDNSNDGLPGTSFATACSCTFKDISSEFTSDELKRFSPVALGNPGHVGVPVDLKEKAAEVTRVCLSLVPGVARPDVIAQSSVNYLEEFMQ